MSEPRAKYEAGQPVEYIFYCVFCQHEIGYVTTIATSDRRLIVLVLVVDGVKVADIIGYAMLHCPKCDMSTAWRGTNV